MTILKDHKSATYLLRVADNTNQLLSKRWDKQRAHDKKTGHPNLHSGDAPKLSIAECAAVIDAVELCRTETPLTQEVLQLHGFQHIHYNPKWNGGFHSWWLAFVGTGDSISDHRLMVTFGEYEQHPVLVWLDFPGNRYAFENIKTLEQLAQLYALLTGKELRKSSRQKEQP